MANKADNSTKLSVGNVVIVIIRAWRADESPTEENFYVGKIKEFVERARYCIYVIIEGIEQLIPIDRVKLA